MRHSILILIAALSTAAMASGAALSFLPGTPCVDVVKNNVPCTATGPVPTASITANDPLFVLSSDPGVVPLLSAAGGGIFVVSGDVVLFESSPTQPSPTDTSLWSDVVEFSNGRDGSIATTFADVEGFGVILPAGFTPSGNAVGIQETLVGNGTDANDFTTYIAGTNTYQIHSDCAGTGCELPEPKEPPTPEPSMMGLLGVGFGGLVVAVQVRSRKVRAR